MATMREMALAKVPFYPRAIDTDGRVIYDPSPWGMEFHLCQVDELLAGGAAGPGKTEALCMDPLDVFMLAQEICESGQAPWGSMGHVKCLYLRREATEVEEAMTRMRDRFARIDKGFRIREEFGLPTGIWSSGAKMICGGCKEKYDYKKYMSNQYVRLYMDELPEFEEIQYKWLQTRVRHSWPEFHNISRTKCASNPDGGWVRRYFVDPDENGRVIIEEKRIEESTGEEFTYRRMFLPGRLEDNPNKAFVREYKRRLMAMPRHIRQQLLYGDWYAVAGAYYGEVWDRSIHVIKPFEIPSYWRNFRSMDWGYRHPGAVHWWAKSPDDVLICRAELMFKMKTDREVALEIREYEERMGLWEGSKSKITGPADTQLWEERGSTAPSKAEVMAKLGVPWVPANKGPKSRQNNAERMISRLKDLRGGLPGLQIFDTCHDLIRTLPAIPAEQNERGGWEPAKVDFDDAHDSACYMVAYRSGKTDEGAYIYGGDDEDIKAAREKRAGGNTKYTAWS